jgi:hypothetical protein
MKLIAALLFLAVVALFMIALDRPTQSAFGDCGNVVNPCYIRLVK